MSIINGANAVVGSAAGGYEIPNSLRFNSADSAYLSRTFGSGGNTQTWTWSAWIKRSSFANNPQRLFYTGNSNDNETDIYLSGDRLTLEYYVAPTNYYLISSPKLRDPSAWYHLVVVVDTTNATSTDRMRLYINGVRITNFDNTSYPAQNANLTINSAATHYIGQRSNGTNIFDGYMAEMHFVGGQALTPSAFGETDTTTGVWKPKEYTGSYGTNGFYLPMTQDQIVEGFNTVLWRGNGGTNRITGVGFAPDLIWAKRRSAIGDHALIDIVRGGSKTLASNLTDAEGSQSWTVTFGNDGFTIPTSDALVNGSGISYVGWCWDAGNSTVTNNIGTIESQVRANPTYGFSIVTYTGNGINGASVGHGLGVKPAFIITKKRSTGTTDYGWSCWHKDLGGTNAGIWLHLTNARNNSMWTDSHTTTTFRPADVDYNNVSGQTYVNYLFAEVSGYSKFGSYSGTGATGNTITLGFKPAFVMIKNVTMSGTSWEMFDNTRDTEGTIDKELLANSSGAEGTYTLGTFSDTGFTLTVSSNGVNASGSTYIYMAFADKREAAFWRDFSGNGNNWQPNNLDFNDSMVDSPTSYGTDTGAGGEVRGNYATLNPLASIGTYSNGNLDWVGQSSGDNTAASTIGVTSGKWYWEVQALSTSNLGTNGVIYDPSRTDLTTTGGYTAPNGYAMDWASSPPLLKYGGTSTSYGTTITATSDVVMVALDLDNQKLYFGRNGTWFNSSNPATGTSPAVSSLPTGKTWFATVGDQWGSASSQWTVNFGQRPFAYTAPSGFKALCTTNLPEPTVADGGEYMSAKLWTGNGSTQSITGVGFQPGLVWTKDRGAAFDHTLFDAVRGATKFLRSNATNAEEIRTDSLTSFDSDGFSVGADAVRNNINKSGASYVSWAWKANGAGVSNNIGTIPSTVSANTTAGFSVVTWSGTGTNGTVGHGLGATPSLVIVKQLNSTANWNVWFEGYGADGYLLLNTTAAKGTYSGNWGAGTFNSTVFSVSSGAWNNGSGSTYVGYVFSEISGFSSFGTYTGNGSADGPFIFTGFRPRWIMVHCSSAAISDWPIYDTSRPTYNQSRNPLYADLANAEATAGIAFDFLSNGFKLREAGGQGNDSGQTYIYAAFAENPFKYALAR